MNLLKQGTSLLIGSAKDIKALEEKTEAKILVVSDVHGNKDIFKFIIQHFGKTCDALVFCGDGIGDLIFCLDETLNDKEFAKCIPPVVAMVEGNGDSDRFPAYFNPTNVRAKKDQVFFEIKIPHRQLLHAAGKSIYIVHGHEQGVYYGRSSLADEAEIAGADVVLYGHTHVAREERVRSFFMINPGSCSMPRGGLPPSVAVVSVSKEYVRTIFFKIEILMSGLNFVPFNPGIR